MKSSICFVIVGAFFLISSVCCVTESECNGRSNTDCQQCLSLSGCAFCKTNKTCVLYDVASALTNKCPLNELQLKTCIVSFQIWIIVVAVLAGVVLLTVLIVCCCISRKCKRRSIRREERRQEQDDQRMQERRAAAEARSVERNRVADQIRMKYGILKDKDTTNDYTRMD